MSKSDPVRLGFFSDGGPANEAAALAEVIHATFVAAERHGVAPGDLLYTLHDDCPSDWYSQPDDPAVPDQFAVQYTQSLRDIATA